MTVDQEHAHPANTITKPQKDHLPVHIKHPGSPKTGSTNKSQLMTGPQSTIASDEQDSDSEDDLN